MHEDQNVVLYSNVDDVVNVIDEITKDAMVVVVVIHDVVKVQESNYHVYANQV